MCTRACALVEVCVRVYVFEPAGIDVYVYTCVSMCGWVCSCDVIIDEFIFGHLYLSPYMACVCPCTCVRAYACAYYPL